MNQTCNNYDKFFQEVNLKKINLVIKKIKRNDKAQ